MAALTPYPVAASKAERTIASARVLLAASGLFAVWLDPAEPARFVQVTYTLHGLYLIYSLSLAGFVWSQSDYKRLPIVTHATDIVVFSVFQYLTLGPSSPFFVYFVFSVFCGALRWGWRGTLATAAAVLASYVAMGASMSRTLGPSEFELNRFVIRILYLLISTVFLVYLGRYEERLRTNLERLARWPTGVDADPTHLIEQVIGYAAGILGAGRSVAIWDAAEEPHVRVAVWSARGLSASIYPPGEFHPVVAERFADATFVSSGQVPGPIPVEVSGLHDTVALPDLEISSTLLELLTGSRLASAPLKTDRISGRIFFTDLAASTVEIVPLTEVVARQVGASLDQLHATEQLKAIAASEERIRLARDLHDGVLQSLTGIRLEIRAVAGALNGNVVRTRERLHAIERALAIEQRELRFFISGLGPGTSAEPPRDDGTLAGRLDALRERIALEWKAPITIRIAHDPPSLPDRVERAIPLMVHEAVVNALKHADPSRVSVTIDGNPGELRIVVSDDGHGFGFRGRYDHAALRENLAAPRSLLERVSSLGGQLSVESSDAGSRVEMRLTL